MQGIGISFVRVTGLIRSLDRVGFGISSSSIFSFGLEELPVPAMVMVAGDGRE